MKTNTKTLAVSLSLLASANALAGMGGLNVQSNLGEPFSGSIVVTGKEAEALLQSRSVIVSGGGISGSVVSQGNGNAVIRLHSGSAVNEPVVNFVVKAGNQTRQYTAMINPARYVPKGVVRKNAVADQPAYATEHDTVDVTGDAKPVRKARTQRRSVAPMARSSNARYHRVQTGETLAQIAARYRPHNMSQQRAMRAIMAANPRAFRRGTNGNIMYDGSTLYIPTGAQFHGYANSKKRHAQRRLGNRRYVAPAATVAPAETAAPQVTPQQTDTPVVTTQPTLPVAPHTTPPTAKVPSEPIAVEPEKKIEPPRPIASSAPASVVVTTPPASVAVAPAVPSTPASAVTPAVASEAMNASAASMPVMEASPASVPVKTAVQPKQPKPVPQPEPEPETDWLPLALGGAAGLALLGGAGYFLSRRRKAAEDVDGDDEFVVVEDDEFVVEETTVSPAVAAAQRVNLGTQTDEPVFNDQDDNVFFEKKAAVNKPAADEFDLNNFEPEDTFQVQPAVTEEAEEQWDWLNDDNSSIDATTQESNWDSDKTATVAATAAVAGVAIATNQRDDEMQEFEATPASVATETSSDDDWLNEIFAVGEAPAVVEETVVESDDLIFEDFNTVSESAPVVEAGPAVAENSDFDLDFDVAESATVSSATTAAPSQNDDLSLDLSDDLGLSENKVMATPAVETVDDLLFDLPAEPETNVSFELDEIEMPAPDSFDLPSEEPVDFNLDLPAEERATDLDLPNEDLVLDTGADLADLDLNVAKPALDSFETDLPTVTEEDALEELGLPADSLVADEEVNAVELDSLNSLSDLDMSFDDEPPVATVETAPALDRLSLDDAPGSVVEDLSWMNATPPVETTVAHNEANAAGFVSEAVGMTAPQEAKLELAKMYLEIDDAVAARETLRELIGESHGELQQQAKDLLADLDG